MQSALQRVLTTVIGVCSDGSLRISARADEYRSYPRMESSLRFNVPGIVLSSFEAAHESAARTLSENGRENTLLQAGIDRVRCFSAFVRSIEILGMSRIGKKYIHNIPTVIPQRNVQTIVAELEHNQASIHPTNERAMRFQPDRLTTVSLRLGLARKRCRHACVSWLATTACHHRNHPILPDPDDTAVYA